LNVEHRTSNLEQNGVKAPGNRLSESGQNDAEEESPMILPQSFCPISDFAYVRNNL
jgi:hypothetical protein